MNDARHLTTEEMVRAIDRELPSSEQARVETHLAQCDACLNEYEQLTGLSSEFKHGLESVTVDVPSTARWELEAALSAPAAKQARGQYVWRWIAAAAAIAVMLIAGSQLWMRNKVPQSARTIQVQPEPAGKAPIAAVAERPPAENASPVEVQPGLRRAEGRESVKRAASAHRANVRPRFSAGFIPLPYSDPSLPMTSPEMVHVEMRLSALTTAGIVRAQPSSDDPLVEADVLLGPDGQPSAIRVLHTSVGR